MPGSSFYAFDISLKTIRKLLAKIVKREAINIALLVASAYDLCLLQAILSRLSVYGCGSSGMPDHQEALLEFVRFSSQTVIINTRYLPIIVNV